VRGLASGFGLLAAVVAAALVRLQGWHSVWAGDRLVPPVGDSYYHVRRAFYSAEHWPALLRFDPLVSFPVGSWIPWPPLHDLLLAAASRALGGGIPGIERAAAWLPPVLAALTVLPVYAAGARLGGRALGLLAAWLVALLPIHVAYSDVGNADHHCSVSLIGAAWLASSLWAATPTANVRVRALAQVGIATARLLMLLTFPGSLLYLGVADGAQIGILALAGRSRARAAHALGLLAGALLVAPVIGWLGPPVGGPFSGIALSWLHVTALLTLATVAAACAALERARPATGAGTRALRTAAVAAGAALVALAIPRLRESVLAAAGFVGKSEPWAALNAEQLPLWRGMDLRSWIRPLRFYGGFAYAIPLVPLVALRAARDPERREPARILAAWTAAFGALAFLQVRYGSDYAPAAAVGFALLLHESVRALRGRLGVAGARLVVGLAAAAAAVPLLWPPLAALAASGRAPTPAAAPELATSSGTLYRFAEQVRAATPETPGFDDPREQPQYSILAPPNIGHVLHWVAHRATATDNFGPYAGSSHFQEASAFDSLPSEEEAFALARRLGARYVVTMEYGWRPPGSLAQRLHAEDGLARDEAPRWERFRLVTEGPRGGQPLTVLFGLPAPRHAVPYKLYEVVEGALLEVSAAPGSEVDAELTVATPTGRRFRYRAQATVDASGMTQIRVPYASETDAPASPEGPWRVYVGEQVREVVVDERAVREGARVAVETFLP
jgi:dolichyl-diphosphooligosaccharide--protein glycosyltransferase